MSENMPFQSPLEQRPEYTSAIGLISIEVGVLEMMLGEMLGAILGISADVSQIIYMTPQSYTGRLEILQNVIDAVMKPDSPGTKKLLGFIKRTRARIQYRNDAVHCVWGVLKSDQKIVTRRPVPFIDKNRPVPVPITELQAQLHKLRELIDEVISETANIIEHRAALVASLEKQRKEGLPAHTIKGDRVDRKNRAQ